MALLTMKDVSVAFGGPPVLENLSLQIEKGDRVCLLGRNGAGKSTLMKVINGDVEPDSGEIIRRADLRVAYLPQEVDREIRGTTLHVVAEGLNRTRDRERFPQGDREWRLEQRAENILSRMNLDPALELETLSAGLKRRVLLARGLVLDPDILLLDEPTNHLDLEAIQWLEDFLLRYGGTLLFVTHDRVFLRRLATRIIELDRGSLVNWACDYDTFLDRKQAVLDAEAVQWARFDKKLAKEETWLRQGIKARRTRNEGRVKALEKMREIRSARRDRTGTVSMRMQEAERSGKLVAEAEDVSFSYGEGQPVIRGFSCTVMRGDKVGIIGPNGAGKTTLLKLLVGDVAPGEGNLRLGTRLEVAYFDQLRAQLDEDKSVQDNVAEGSDTVTINGAKRHVIGYLRDFLFSPERARSPVSVLSGGERNRLLLARLFTRPSNVLVMDEPTNDLDSETLELLEDLLLEYPGTLFLVSHDRAFLNNVVTSTLVFEGDGQVTEYIGGYDDWLRQRNLDSSPLANRLRKDPESVKLSSKSSQGRKPDRARKLSFNEQRELERLPERIEALESERNAIYEFMAQPELYKKESEEIVKIRIRLESLERELEEAYERWEMLEAING